MVRFTIKRELGLVTKMNKTVITFTIEEIKQGFEEIIKTIPGLTIDDYANGAGVVKFLVEHLPKWKKAKKNGETYVYVSK